MKFCPECGSILSDTKCSVCGYEESITEKKISTKTSSVTKNNLLNNIDKIHTSYKSWKNSMWLWRKKDIYKDIFCFKKYFILNNYLRYLIPFT